MPRPAIGRTTLAKLGLGVPGRSFKTVPAYVGSPIKHAPDAFFAFCVC